MILLLLAAILFLILTTSTGFYLNKIFFGHTHSSPGLFKDLLTGTAAITIFLNVASVFLPTNYLLLIPVCMFAIAIALKTGYKAAFVNSLRSNAAILFYKSNAIVTTSVLLVLILFTLVAPYNTDSSGYHFLSILWNEKFKAVPGLANLFAQYGYNSSFFVLSAAFSFTDLTGQSIYPINCILIIAFFCSMLKKSFQLKVMNKLLTWLLLIIFLRQFPINLSSPSADPLASILVFYVLFSIFFKQHKANNINWDFLLFLSCFALIIKLSTLPLLLVALLPLVINNKNRKDTLLLYFKLLPAGLLILVPWVIRNIILSGYLVFPFPADFFSFDWKVPSQLVTAEKLHIAHAPRMIDANWAYVNTLPISAWFPIWLPKVWLDNRFNFVLVISSLLSPILMVVLAFQKKLKRVGFLLWLIAYTATWFWLISSPDVRFGYHYMLPCIFFPLLIFSEDRELKWANGYFKHAMVAVAGLVCFYYDLLAIKKLTPNRFSQMVVYPLKSPEYFKNNDVATFKYVVLNNHVKLYIHDSAHHSINAPLPSCAPYRPGIRMRGNKLEDGFRTQP